MISKSSQSHSKSGGEIERHDAKGTEVLQEMFLQEWFYRDEISTSTARDVLDATRVRAREIDDRDIISESLSALNKVLNVRGSVARKKAEY